MLALQFGWASQHLSQAFCSGVFRGGVRYRHVVPPQGSGAPRSCPPLPFCNIVRLKGLSTFQRRSSFVLHSQTWVGFVACSLSPSPICSIHWRRCWMRDLTPHICSPSSLSLFVHIHLSIPGFNNPQDWKVSEPLFPLRSKTRKWT